MTSTSLLKLFNVVSSEVFKVLPLLEVGSRKDDYFCFGGRELLNKNHNLSQAI